MVLHTKDRPAPMAHPFKRVVVKVDVCGFQIARQRFGPDGEAVILRGDLDFIRSLVQYGLIGPAMSEFELEGF